MKQIPLKTAATPLMSRDPALNTRGIRWRILIDIKSQQRCGAIVTDADQRT